MSDELAPREITISDEMIFPDIKSLKGVVERRSVKGFVLRATIGKTVQYSAADAYGSPLRGTYLQMTDAAPHGSARSRCYFCVESGGNLYCTEVLCPDPPI
ncbi:MAG TPA: hypothetical protein VIG37_17105 [Methylomirabilota bacterium]|jgi:hypothetical protein